MKNVNKILTESKNDTEKKSGVVIDKKLDKIKHVNFVSNKIEEANAIISKLVLNH